MTKLAEEDRSLSVLAHLSGYAGYLIPCGGVVAPIILLATAKSPRVAAIAKQALLLNVLGFLSVLLTVVAFAPLSLAAHKSPVLSLTLGVVGGALALLVLGLIALCPLIGAIKASQGEYFRYPLFGVSDPRS
ncbi:MAG: DUF4870 domain-containing protein [Archangium sp.]